jgi:hypothetical protein
MATSNPCNGGSSTSIVSLNNSIDDPTLALLDVEEIAFMNAKSNLEDINSASTANASNEAASEAYAQGNAQTNTQQATNTLTSVRNQTPLMQMLSIAPNPASSLALVQLPVFSGEARLEVFSMRGDELFRAVLLSNVSGSRFPLDVTNFANGMYVVRFYGVEVRASSQILVNR